MHTDRDPQLKKYASKSSTLSTHTEGKAVQNNTHKIVLKNNGPC
jgi:hypothetical protein